MKENIFDSIWNNSIVGILLVSKDGLILHANDIYLNVIEYNLAEIQLKTFQSITHPDDVDSDVEMTKRIYDGEVPSYRMKKRYITKTGVIVWVLLNVSPVRSSDGEFICYLAQVTELINLNPPILSISTVTDSIDVFKWARTNWQMIVFGLTAIAGIISYVIKEFKN